MRIIRKLVAATTLALAGGVTAGLVASTTPAIATVSPGEQAVYKRKDDLAAVLQAVDDQDDDDTVDRDRAMERDDTSISKTTRGTGSSRSRVDKTNSRYGHDSRDRDRSRGDRTRDWTRDGAGGKKHDWSRNKTNDRSRHDTRHGRWS